MELKFNESIFKHQYTMKSNIQNKREFTNKSKFSIQNNHQFPVTSRPFSTDYYRNLDRNHATGVWNSSISESMQIT